MKLKISGDKLTFASAHMLTRHDKCARLHGHNYDIEVEVEGKIDENNMLIDFGIFKKAVGKIVKKFDHRILIPDFNKDLNITTTDKQVIVDTCEGRYYRFPREDVILLPLEATTVELLAKYFHSLIKEQYPQFKITITMAETPTSVVTYTE
ncbi:MAG: 6-carboxytetrahydropterin synthase [Candidatus Heimdallarchaeota archaeon]|nr:6-carboxytetrahydropterin synthase [Candidatus Heimdallarchaeota archaeon]MCK5142903.1 6-carboxytetrahydropterin synthase [Candidatus Heimdallarchaeota archaeon]